MQLLPSRCIMTSGADGHVHVWSKWGVHMALLVAEPDGSVDPLNVLRLDGDDIPPPWGTSTQAVVDNDDNDSTASEVIYVVEEMETSSVWSHGRRHNRHGGHSFRLGRWRHSEHECTRGHPGVPPSMEASRG
jgi:hypothetical protein